MSDRTEVIRAWVEGNYVAEAGVELLTRGPKPGMLDDERPWIVKNGNWSRERGDGYDIDTTTLLKETGAWSSGERARVAVAASLLGASIDLSDIIPSLDVTGLNEVLAAIAHAGGNRDAWSSLFQG